MSNIVDDKFQNWSVKINLMQTNVDNETKFNDQFKLFVHCLEFEVTIVLVFNDDRMISESMSIVFYLLSLIVVLV
jgi:hypothetical protein